MKQINIIMFNMLSYDDWQKGNRNRNYFILHELLKRDEVGHIIAVDYLPVTWKRKLHAVLDKIQGKPLVREIDKKLTVISVFDLKRLYKDISLLLASKLLLLDSNIVLWSYFPLYIDYFDKIPARLKIFDAVDDWSEHPVYKRYKKQLIENYKAIAQKADVIFTVAENLKNRLFLLHTHVLWIPNGVDCNEFKGQRSKVKGAVKNSKTTIGYIGTIQSRINFDLVKYLAEHHADKEFVFVGPLWKDAEIKKVKDCSNVRFAGWMPYNKLGEYLAVFDVGIIPHKIDNFTVSMNPLKFYEYLSFGLPVVSTCRMAEDENLCYSSNSYADFSAMIDKAIAENSYEKAAKRKEFAKEQSWAKRVDEMMKYIMEYET